MTSTNPIDKYIEGQNPIHKDNLCAVRDAIRKELPGAEERISWSMPTWWKGYNLIHFAAAKKHIGIYPGTEAVEHFADEFTKRGLKFCKVSMQFPDGAHLPLDLIAEIARWCGEHNTK